MGIWKEQKEQMKSIRSMKPKDVVSYLWEYFRLYLFLFLLVVVFLVLILQAFFGEKKETVFSALFVSVPADEQMREKLEKGFVEDVGIDTKTSDCFFDIGTAWNGTSAGENDQEANMANLQKIVVTVAAGDCDLAICDLSSADYLAKGEAAGALEKTLGTELFQAYEGAVFYLDREKLSEYERKKQSGEEVDRSEIQISKDTSGMKDPMAVGLDIKADYERKTGISGWEGEVIACIPVTARHKEMAVSFLKYLAQ
ncbi:MAG: hypothetical protein IJ733_03440 [Lachnospiraceae bacterium]|nr:hypothetical protein [Lachnospiraceae bacterium]